MGSEFQKCIWVLFTSTSWACWLGQSEKQNTMRCSSFFNKHKFCENTIWALFDYISKFNFKHVYAGFMLLRAFSCTNPSWKRHSACNQTQCRVKCNEMPEFFIKENTFTHSESGVRKDKFEWFWMKEQKITSTLHTAYRCSELHRATAAVSNGMLWIVIVIYSFIFLTRLLELKLWVLIKSPHGIFCE